MHKEGYTCKFVHHTKMQHLCPCTQIINYLSFKKKKNNKKKLSVNNYRTILAKTCK
jgi:hypothetical protein